MSSFPIYFMALHKPQFYYAIFILSFLLHHTAATDGPEFLVGRRRIPTQNWINHGGDLYNRRYAYQETKISNETASNLRLRWRFYTGKDITATPAIYGGTLYFPCWNGYLYAVNARSGSLVWKRDLQKMTGLLPIPAAAVANITSVVSRTTPTVAGRNLLIIGISGPAVVVAVKRSTGELVWMRQLDNHPNGIITMSGTYHHGAFYVGTSSSEEGAGIGVCCVFRGSFSKIDVHTGRIVWQTYMLPENHNRTGGYAGAAIWGSSPSIDVLRRHVYIATGNLYSAPQPVLECQEKENNQTKPSGESTCVEPDNHSNSILALDLGTGKIKWYRQLGGYDVFFYGCFLNPSDPSCPPGPSPDADFGEAPIMFTALVNGTKRDLVAAVQKSGFAWALDRSNGNITWFTKAGPGGFGGGGIWGAATDGSKVYTNIANSGGENFTLVPSMKNSTVGGWVAMDANSGKILWSIANPSNATASGPVTVANGVVFAGSTNQEGPIYGIDAESGSILWSYKTGGTVYGGLSVSNGCIYVGHGYKVALGAFNPNYTPGDSLFAFCV